MTAPGQPLVFRPIRRPYGTIDGVIRFLYPSVVPMGRRTADSQHLPYSLTG